MNPFKLFVPPSEQDSGRRISSWLGILVAAIGVLAVLRFWPTLGLLGFGGIGITLLAITVTVFCVGTTISSLLVSRSQSSSAGIAAQLLFTISLLPLLACLGLVLFLIGAALLGKY